LCWWCLVCSHRWPRLGAAPQCGFQPPALAAARVAHRVGAFVVVHRCQPLGASNGVRRRAGPASGVRHWWCRSSTGCQPLTGPLPVACPTVGVCTRSGWPLSRRWVGGHPVVLTPDGFVVDGVAAHRWWPPRWPVPRWVVSIAYPRDSGALRYPRPGGHPPCPGGEFTFGCGRSRRARGEGLIRAIAHHAPSVNVPPGFHRARPASRQVTTCQVATRDPTR